MLKLTIDWSRTLPLRVPLDFQLDLPGVPSSIVGTSGTGTLDISATGHVTVGLRLPLTAAAIADPLPNLLVDPSSGAHVDVDVDSSGATLAANLGPLALSVGDPSSSDPGTEIHGKLGFALTATGSDPMSLTDFFSGLSVTPDRNDDVTCDGVSGSPPAPRAVRQPAAVLQGRQQLDGAGHRDPGRAAAGHGPHRPR